MNLPDVALTVITATHNIHFIIIRIMVATLKPILQKSRLFSEIKKNKMWL